MVDTDTAVAIFEQYLLDLPDDLDSISKGLESGDAEQLRQVLHKKKVVFSYVGLTDVTADLGELENKCSAKTDPSVFKPEVEKIFNRINSSTVAVRAVLGKLQEEQS